MKQQHQWQAKKVNLGNAIICAVITLVTGLAIGIYSQDISRNILPYLGFKTPNTNNWSALDEVYDSLSSHYDGEIDRKALVEGAKKGLVEAVGDQYTTYMSTSEASEFQKSLHGKIGAGIGIEMALRDGYVRVIRTLPDNPARKAGILAGDILYKVNDEEVYALSSEKIASKIRGTAGSKVKVTIVRDGAEKTFEMIREEINNVSADISYDQKTAIIKVTRFDTDTGKIVRGFAEKFKELNINKVILDLRGNGGGYVSAAQDLLSLWIDGQKILTQKSKHTGTEHLQANHGQAILSNMKTVVLVNDATASASEITAGALKDYKKATILGQKTYGKGVVQNLLKLSHDSLLKVTAARWYTPNGHSIDKTGIKPDKEIINTYEDINAGRDPQLDAAKAL